MLKPIDIVKAARNEINECDNKDLCDAIDAKKLIIDVREPEEYTQGFIAHSINVPRGLIEFAIFDHPAIKPHHHEELAQTEIYVYCKSGGRSALAAKSLKNLGFQRVTSLKEGIMGWEKEGYKIDTTQDYHY